MPNNAVTQAGVNYINGVHTVNETVTVFPFNGVAQAYIPQNTYTLQAASGNLNEIYQTRLSTGEVLPTNIIGTISDRAPNAGSGFNVDGTINYGSGPRNIVTKFTSFVLPSGDLSNKAGQQFVFSNGASGLNFKYNSLSS